MRLFAVIADVHANWPALRAVQRHATGIADREGLGPVTFVGLGDIVDYGPHPRECLDWVGDHLAGRAVLGNHDREAIQPLGVPPLMDMHHWPVHLWTRLQLRPSDYALIPSWPEHLVLAELPGLEFFHSSLDVPDGYIRSGADARANFAQLQRRYACFGHTHVQGHFIQRGEQTEIGYAVGAKMEPIEGWSWQPVNLDEWLPLPDGPALLNPGSVGQPRAPAVFAPVGLGTDLRAAYLLLTVDDQGRGYYSFQRTDYAKAETLQALEEIVWPAPPVAIWGDGPGSDQIHDLVANIDQRLKQQIGHLKAYLSRS